MTNELKNCPMTDEEILLLWWEEDAKTPYVDQSALSFAKAIISRIQGQAEPVAHEWPRSNGEPFPVDGWTIHPELLSRIVNNIDVQPSANEWQVSMEQVEEVLLATERLGLLAALSHLRAQHRKEAFEEVVAEWEKPWGLAQSPFIDRLRRLAQGEGKGEGNGAE